MASVRHVVLEADQTLGPTVHNSATSVIVPVHQQIRLVVRYYQLVIVLMNSSGTNSEVLE